MQIGASIAFQAEAKLSVFRQHIGPHGDASGGTQYVLRLRHDHKNHPTESMDSSLTPREKEVLDLLRLGLSNRAIAARLEIGLDTARRYASRVKQKTGVASTFALPCAGLTDQPDWPVQLKLDELQISEAEMRVLRLLCRGHSSKHIGRVLQISPRTVDKHRERLLRKCQLQSTRQLTAWLASQYAKCGIGKTSDET